MHWEKTVRELAESSQISENLAKHITNNSRNYEAYAPKNIISHSMSPPCIWPNYNNHRPLGVARKT